MVNKFFKYLKTKVNGTNLFLHIFKKYIIEYSTGILLVNSNNDDQRIINGRQAFPNEFPYQVGLMYKDTGKIPCGGSIISARFVLTASHCVCHAFTCPIASDDLEVYAGEISVTPTSNAVFRDIEKLFPHPDFQPVPRTFRNDIALVLVRFAYLYMF